MKTTVHVTTKNDLCVWGGVVYICICAHVYMGRSEVSTGYLPLLPTSPYLLRQDLLLKLELTDWLG